MVADVPEFDIEKIEMDLKEYVCLDCGNKFKGLGNSVICPACKSSNVEKRIGERMKIRFLYFKGCPNAEPTLNLLKQVCCEEKGLNEKIEVTEVRSEEEAKKYNFLGSPTIQINDLDIERERRNDIPVFGCRVYKTKVESTGIPPREMIVEALEEAISKTK